jgi:hypothetical protein
VKGVHLRRLTDDLLRPGLEARNIIFFLDQSIKLHEIERQVDRLGFGYSYLVSATERPATGGAKILLKPRSSPQPSSRTKEEATTSPPSRSSLSR